jgi:hypothetical protein
LPFLNPFLTFAEKGKPSLSINELARFSGLTCNPRANSPRSGWFAARPDTRGYRGVAGGGRHPAYMGALSQLTALSTPSFPASYQLVPPWRCNKKWVVFVTALACPTLPCCSSRQAFLDTSSDDYWTIIGRLSDEWPGGGDLGTMANDSTVSLR